jgi:hypothetical protein
MTINNNLPTFKGLAHERPISSIHHSEFRASTLVQNNDSSHLLIIQHTLFDSALLSFQQLQTSSNRINIGSNFNARFYKRYFTRTKIQNLCAELRLLLFQNGDEHTLVYCSYLTMLLIELHPNCSENWRKHKFKQKFFFFLFLFISLFYF